MPHLKKGVLKPQSSDKRMHRLSHKRSKDAMKVKGRKVRQLRKPLEWHWLRQVLADVVDHSVDPAQINLL
jgi:hypothetical protein